MYAIRKNMEKIYQCNPDNEVLVMPLFWGFPCLDYSGNQNHGTPSGGVTYHSGSLDFVGVNDSIHLPASNSIVADAPITVTAWVKSDGSGGAASRVFSLHRGATAGSGLAIIGVSGANWLSYCHDGTTGAYLDSGVAVNTLWHQIATTNDDTTHKIYIDGLFKASQLKGAAFGSYNGYIGHYDGIFAKNSWGGLIDEVRISNTVRTADQIALFYERPWDLYRRVSRPFYSVAAAPLVGVPIGAIAKWHQMQNMRNNSI